MINRKYYSAIKIIEEAGSIIREKWLEEVKIHKKSKFDIVTDLDISIQKFIIFELRKYYKDSTFISEEKNFKEFSNKNTWFIDPIDGTTNFIHKYPHFSIAISHVVDNTVIFTAVYNPIINELYIAEKDNGAYLNGVRIKVSNTNQLSDSIIAIGLPYNRKKTDLVFDICKKFFESCQDIKRKGSSTLDFAYVACGRVDGYFEVDLKEWEVTSGMLLVSEAGGSIIRIQNALSYEKVNGIIACNGIIQKKILSLIQI